MNEMEAITYAIDHNKNKMLRELEKAARHAMIYGNGTSWTPNVPPPHEMRRFRMKRKRSGPVAVLPRRHPDAVYQIIHNQTGRVMQELTGRTKARELCRTMNQAASAHDRRSERDDGWCPRQAGK